MPGRMSAKSTTPHPTPRRNQRPPAIETVAFTLTERQRQVRELRSAGLTYAAIGRELGISGERVRQIEMRLLRRLRLT